MASANISNLSPAARQDYDLCVASLGVKHRQKEALRLLMKAGSAATFALRRGLRHDSPTVRVGCCQVLDHFLDPDAVPELTDNLDHANDAVRSWAMHALACDRCKEGTCRPAEDDIAPIAIRMLHEDPSRTVRVQAAHMLGLGVHRNTDALRALEWARDHDTHPLVRKVARWYTPGGPRYERLRPKIKRPNVR
ncbi:MAG: HEAT repeat domain-containing protein [Gammaproteobacteria bacterium]|nr:HEAT repeat domain-containing protein [Gammaproteobacteria bacterium]